MKNFKMTKRKMKQLDDLYDKLKEELTHEQMDIVHEIVELEIELEGKSNA